MHALRIVIAAERFELARQVERIPEQHPIENLTPNGTDQPLDERMRGRGVGCRFNFLDVEYPQIGKPAVKAKQGIVVNAEVFRQSLSSHGVVKHPAYTHAINGCVSHAEADKAAGEQVRYPAPPDRLSNAGPLDGISDRNRVEYALMPSETSATTIRTSDIMA